MTSTASWTRASGVVADASAVVALILNDAAAPALRTRLSGVLWYAPAVIDLEVLNAIRRSVLHREMNTAAAEAALHAYSGIEIMRFAHDPFFHRIWQLRANLTAYDAAYVVLAEAMKFPLITRDARLAKSAPPTARVELF